MGDKTDFVRPGHIFFYMHKCHSIVVLWFIKWVQLTKKQTITHTITIDKAVQHYDKGEWLNISL